MLVFHSSHEAVFLAYEWLLGVHNEEALLSHGLGE
jgi:hypothetical protein